MTPKEYLIKKGHSPEAIVCNDWNLLNSDFDLEEMLEDYHQTKLNNNEVLDLVNQQRELLKSFADEAQEKMYDQPDNDLSDFIDDFLKDFYSC